MMSRRPPYAASGSPPPTTLAEASHVRLQPGTRLHPTEGDAAARHHLVEDDHRAVRSAHVDNRLEESGLGRHAPHVADDRFDDHRGDVLAAGREQTAERACVVEGQREGRAAVAMGTPAESGTPKVAAPLPAFTSKKSACP